MKNYDFQSIMNLTCWSETAFKQTRKFDKRMQRDRLFRTCVFFLNRKCISMSTPLCVILAERPYCTVLSEHRGLVFILHKIGEVLINTVHFSVFH